MVRSGTALQICANIRAAGYSPHDYVYQVTRGGQPYTVPSSRRIRDYTHVVQATNTFLTLHSLLPAPGGSYQLLADSASVTVSTLNGTLTDLDGNALTNDANSGNNGGSGHDGYIWTRTGAASLTLRDVFYLQIEYPRQHGWFYRPNWSGPDGARMSRIWASVPACAG